MPPRRRRLLLAVLLIAAVLPMVRFGLLPLLGNLLVDENPPQQADAAVVLATGVEYYPRLMQAAALVGQGYADRIVINGNRKSDALRELEAKGYVPAVPWYENYLRILEVLEVSREKVITVSLEDVYDTRTEAAGVIEALRAQDIRRILLVTSRYHTARAAFIWRREAGGRLQITPVAARQDPFDPGGWWEDGRQIRWLLNEYGGWLFYLWQTLWPEGRDAHSRAPAD